LRNSDAAKQLVEQLKIAECGKINERAAIGDDQGLPDLASSVKFIDVIAVRFAIFRRVDGVRDAPPLQQLHERKPLQTKFVGGAQQTSIGFPYLL